VIKPSDSPLKNGRLRTKSYNQYAFSSLFPSSSSQSPEGRNGTLSQKRQNSDLKSQISSPNEDNLYPTFSLDSPYDFKQDQASNLVPSKELGGFSKFKLNEFGRSSKKLNTTSRGSPTLSQTSTRLGLETLNTSFSQKFYTEGNFFLHCSP